jgi:hypothetical protein
MQMHNAQRVSNSINIALSQTLETECTSLIPKRPLDVVPEALQLLLLKIPEVKDSWVISCHVGRGVRCFEISKFNWCYLYSVNSWNNIYVITVVKLLTGNDCQITPKYLSVAVKLLKPRAPESWAVARF